MVNLPPQLSDYLFRQENLSMPVRRPPGTSWVYSKAASWRVWAQRFSFIFFLALAFGLLFISRGNYAAVERLRARALDFFAPALDAMARPVVLAENALQRVNHFINLQAENEKLRAENARMIQWQNAAIALENQNRELRSLLNYKAEPALSYISARVIADTGGPYVRALIVTAGREDGVREGMAAMTGEGLIGRVVEVGEWSSRILLITDLSSRIPVIIAGSGEHAILAGENRPNPRLLYLPQDAVVHVGSRVMTSGHGGVFPPELPVGIVTSVDKGGIEVTPLSAIGRINQVRLVDFNLKGGAFNPMAGNIEAGSRPR